MGEIVKASCSCGFDADDISIGCGMSITYYAPAVCFVCGTLKAEEYYGDDDCVKEYNCKRCRAPLYFLNEPGLFSPPDLAREFPGHEPWDIAQVTWGETPRESYPEVRYACPKCHALTLAFEEMGIWD